MPNNKVVSHEECLNARLDLRVFVGVAVLFAARTAARRLG